MISVEVRVAIGLVSKDEGGQWNVLVVYGRTVRESVCLTKNRVHRGEDIVPGPDCRHDETKKRERGKNVGGRIDGRLLWFLNALGLRYRKPYPY